MLRQDFFFSLFSFFGCYYVLINKLYIHNFILFDIQEDIKSEVNMSSVHLTRILSMSSKGSWEGLELAWPNKS